MDLINKILKSILILYKGKPGKTLDFGDFEHCGGKNKQHSSYKLEMWQSVLLKPRMFQYGAEDHEAARPHSFLFVFAHPFPLE